MRSHHVHGVQAIQFLLKSLEHNPMRALADEFPDVDVAQPTERVFVFGRFQKVDDEVAGLECRAIVNVVIVSQQRRTLNQRRTIVLSGRVFADGFRSQDFAHVPPAALIGRQLLKLGRIF